MLRDLRESSGTNLSCFTTLPRHAPSASLNQNFPPPPISRFPGDGLDGRWPAMSRSMPANADIIDLTEDPDITLDHHPQSRRTFGPTHNSRHTRIPQNIINLAEFDDADDTNVPLEDDDGSSDVEIVGSNTIRNPPIPPSPYQTRLPSFPRPTYFDAPPQLPRWAFPVEMLGRLPSFMRPQLARPTEPRVRIPTPIRPGGPGIERHYTPIGFQLPDLNFDTPAFPIGNPDPPRPPTAPTYSAPSPVAEGFTRT